MPMPSPLITVEELRRVLDTAPPVLLDVRYSMAPGAAVGVEAYAAGHLPGAVYVDLDTDLAAPPGAGGRHPLPDPEAFLTAMRRAGVSGQRPVVVYDDWQGLAAARAWWLLGYYGHQDVRLLDGGLAAWRAAGGPEDSGVVDVSPGDFTGESGHLRVTTVAQVLDAEVVLDARAPERYAGQVEPIDPVAGHIPGARNVPTSDNLTPEGTFRTPVELAARYAEAGAVPGADVTAYCGSGVTACHDIVALRLAQIDAALQPESWSGWITDPRRPVARGTVPQ